MLEDELERRRLKAEMEDEFDDFDWVIWSASKI